MYIEPITHYVCSMDVHKCTDIIWKSMAGGVENRKSGRKESKVIIIIIFHSFPLPIHSANLQNPKPTEGKNSQFAMSKHCTESNSQH